jgi:hypothetical protein
MVVDAVQIEPVSTSNSLLTGKRTGNFTETGPSAGILVPIGELIQWFASKFPAQRNRESSNPYQGKFFKDQGNFHAKLAISEF